MARHMYCFALINCVCWLNVSFWYFLIIGWHGSWNLMHNMKCMHSETSVRSTTPGSLIVWQAAKKPPHDSEMELPPRLRCELQVSMKWIPKSRPKLQMHFGSTEADQFYVSYCLLISWNTIPENLGTTSGAFDWHVIQSISCILADLFRCFGSEPPGCT